MSRYRKNSKSTSKKALKYVFRFLIFLLITILFVLLLVVAALEDIFHGNSDTLKTLAVNTFKETSAMKWIPDLFLDEDEVSKLLALGEMAEVDEGTYSDSSLVDVSEEKSEELEIIEISGGTYKGFVMIIADPSRVFLGKVPVFCNDTGETVGEMIERYNTELGYNVVGGVNCGEFYDAGIINYTALPVGGVICEGEVEYGDLNETYHLTCLTNEGRLLLGNITLQEALNLGVRDAVYNSQAIGPFLIMNGEILTNELPNTASYGGGKNPRTAIGQREDGSIILLVVDGRQTDSLGATFKELAYLMKEYGAVNAAAMDGGNSTQMYYMGECLNSPFGSSGGRTCCTAWLVQ